MNEIREELNKWGDIPCSWIQRLNNFKMSVLPNLISIQCNYNVKWIREQATEWEKIFVKDTCNKGLLFKICKYLKTQQ